MAGFFFTGEENLSPTSVERKRKLIDALWPEATSTAPVGHWSAGAARIVNALANRMEEGQLSRAEKAGNDRVTAFLQQQLGAAGSSPPVAPAAAGASASAPAAAPLEQNVSQGTGDIGARLAADLQRDFGLKPEQSAGVVGNLAHESGNFRSLQEIRPTVPGSRGGYGYAQWTGPRRVAFENWSKENGLDPTSYAANYGFLKHELTNTGEGKVLNALKAAPDVGTATQVFSDQFLRPGVPAMGSRMKYAQQYLGGGASPAQAPVQVAQAGGPATDAPAPGATQAQFNVPGAQQAPAGNSRLAAALADPWLMRNPMVQGLVQQQLAGNKLQYQTLPDGTVLALDPTGRRPPTPVYQAPTRAQWGVIAKDEFGSEKYGWIDQVNRTTTPGQSPAPAGQPAAAPSSSPAAPPAPGQTAPAAPGIPPAPPGVDPKVWRAKQTEKLVSPEKLTEVQSKDLNFYQRGVPANEALTTLEGSLTGKIDTMASKVPGVGNYLVGADFQKASNAAKDFLAVILRKDTGAAVTPSEVETYGEIFLPKPGDSTETVTQKREARARAIEGIRLGLGSAKDLVEFARPKGQQQAGKPNAAPIRVTSPDEARKLPKGTPIILPDGRQGVVP